jgi:hypothetical protein
MHERNCSAGLALQSFQIAEQGGDIPAGIFIGHMDSYQRVKDQKRWPVAHDGGVKFRLIVGLHFVRNSAPLHRRIIARQAVVFAIERLFQ